MDKKKALEASWYLSNWQRVRKILDPHFCRLSIEINLQGKMKSIRNKMYPSLSNLACLGKPMCGIRNNLHLIMTGKKFPLLPQTL